MKIGEFAAACDCPVESVRYYEHVGLLPEPSRMANGFRLYTAEHLERLRFIRLCRSIGLGQDQVRLLLSLNDGRLDSNVEINNHVAELLEDVRTKLRQLKKIQLALEQLNVRQVDKLPASGDLLGLFIGLPRD